MAGIEESLETILETEELITDSFDFLNLLKNGSYMDAIPKSIEVVTDLTEFSDVGKTLPELQDIDVQEAIKLGQASYEAFKRIAAHLAAKKS